VTPEETSARNLAMFCHLGPLLGFLVPLVGNILVPLFIWMAKKDEIPFVDHHGKEAVNFQITVSICAIVSMILSLVVIGIFLMIAVGIAALILLILAAVAASRGELYRYPVSIRLVK
jgi:uncharacterized Tic20 family protein